MTLEFQIQPTPKQSARFYATKNGKIGSHKAQKVINFEAKVWALVKSQIPPNHKPFEGCLRVTAEYQFELPKSYPVRFKKAVEAGQTVYKVTKPDLTDNLNKGLFDAMNGLVYKDDAIIADFHPVKVYKKTAGIVVHIEEIEQIQPIK